jgi:signal transduction histidine kinase
VAIIDPSRIEDRERPPTVLINEARADGDIVFGIIPPPVSSSTGAGGAVTQRTLWSSVVGNIAGIRLRPGQGKSLFISYSANVFAGAQKVRYRYRLEGRDKEWIDAGQQRFVHLSNLAPGNYLFRVTACNGHGVWNSEGVGLPLVLQPFFYQTWTFYAGCAAAGLVGVGSLQAYRLSVQRRLLGLHRDAAIAGERERIARDMHDDIGASLTRISLLAEAARKQAPTADVSTSELDKISAISGQVVDSIGEMVWATNPKYDTAGTMLAYFRQYTAQFLAPLGVAARFDFPDCAESQPVKAELRRQLFLVLKEALHNIVKHAGAIEVIVALRFSDHHIEMTVADNGRGMALPADSHFRHGLINMRDRMTALAGEFEIKSEPGQGTCVKVGVPLSDT